MVTPSTIDISTPPPTPSPPHADNLVPRALREKLPSQRGGPWGRGWIWELTSDVTLFYFVRPNVVQCSVSIESHVRKSKNYEMRFPNCVLFSWFFCLLTVSESKVPVVIGKRSREDGINCALLLWMVYVFVIFTVTYQTTVSCLLWLVLCCVALFMNLFSIQNIVEDFCPQEVCETCYSVHVIVCTLQVVRSRKFINDSCDI